MVGKSEIPDFGDFGVLGHAQDHFRLRNPRCSCAARNVLNFKWLVETGIRDTVGKQYFIRSGGDPGFQCVWARYGWRVGFSMIAQDFQVGFPFPLVKMGIEIRRIHWYQPYAPEKSMEKDMHRPRSR